jgi:hypothetical protein
MTGATNQELSSAAIHQLLRGIAERDWTKIDHTATPTEVHPTAVETSVPDDVFEDTRDNDELTPSPISRGRSTLDIPSPADLFSRWAFPDGAPISVIRWPGPLR